ncbi:hypothetical protein G3I19_01555, partial [Streptomyces sp. SID10853]|nr:hypothetical protein [Streptomyces sp. SID10853]
MRGRSEYGRRDQDPRLPAELRALGRTLGDKGRGDEHDGNGGPGAEQSMAERVLARIVAEGATAPGQDPARLPEPGRFERARAWARSRLDWFEGPGGPSDTGG